MGYPLDVDLHPDLEDIPMTLGDKVHGFRLQALRWAHQLGPVSSIRRELGVSKALFYCGKPRSSAAVPMRCSFARARTPSGRSESPGAKSRCPAKESRAFYTLETTVER